jgi:hypothetical protein
MTATFFSRPGPRVVDYDVTHRHGGQIQQLIFVVVCGFVFDQVEVCLVNDAADTEVLFAVKPGPLDSGQVLEVLVNFR